MTIHIGYTVQYPKITIHHYIKYFVNRIILMCKRTVSNEMCVLMHGDALASY